MASKVKLAKGKEFQFKAATRGGQVSRYDWDSWFDGSLWMIERDIVDEDGTVTEKRDYDTETTFMPAKVKSAGRRKYKVVQVSRLDADGNRLKDALIIKARDMTDEERQLEDILRAEEKAAIQDKRAAKKAETNGDLLAPPV